jgi:hypothetical protein
MDDVLGTKTCPTLTSALRWLSSDEKVPELVVVSNHEQMLLQMKQAKLSGQYQDQFSKVHLLYLQKPKDSLRQDLEKQTAGGRIREPAGVQYTLHHYERFHIVFSHLADQTVDCSRCSIKVVAAQVEGIVRSFGIGAAKPVATPDYAAKFYS